MAVLKFSQISASGSNFTSSDFLLAVQGGTADVLFSLAQAQSGIIGGISGTTVTANAPVINIAQTWNNAAITFEGIKFAVTATAQNAASTALHILGGTAGTKHVLRLTAFGNLDLGEDTTGTGDGRIRIIEGGTYGPNPSYQLGPLVLSMGATTTLQFTQGHAGDVADVLFKRDAAGIFAQRNSTNAQTHRVYNTFTDSSNYERGVFDWTTTSNVLTIGVQVLGTGTARDLRLIVPSTKSIYFNVNGADQFRIDNGTINVLGGYIAFAPGPSTAAINVVGTNLNIANTSGGFADLWARFIACSGVTVSNLPGSPTAGQVAYVTDGAASLAWGATVTGGSSTHYLVWYNGSNWTIAGK